MKHSNLTIDTQLQLQTMRDRNKSELPYYKKLIENPKCGVRLIRKSMTLN